MFYILALQPLIDHTGKYFTYYRYSIVNKGDMEWPWLHGIAFSNPPSSPFRLKLEDDDDAGEFSDFVVNPIPLVTERFRKVLENCGVSNVEYYPVVMDNAEGFEDFPNYFAINVIGKVAAADPSQSKYTEAFGHMGANLFDKFVLNPHAVAGLDFFILAEHLSSVVVSERVKTACESAGVDTLRFNPIESLS